MTIVELGETRAFVRCFGVLRGCPALTISGAGHVEQWQLTAAGNVADRGMAGIVTNPSTSSTTYSWTGAGGPDRHAIVVAEFTKQVLFTRTLSDTLDVSDGVPNTTRNYRHSGQQMFGLR